MLAREDFYTILEQTLVENHKALRIYADSVAVTDVDDRCSMFINAKLNAIISSSPSEAVINYLKTEYNVNGSFIRRVLVKAYLFAATTLVKAFSQKGIELRFGDDIDKDNILIYPCNKKIRLFDFRKRRVYTVLKRGFPALYIHREIRFRLEHKAPFVPQIIDSGKWFYSEHIINGIPLARINDDFFVAQCKEQAYNMVISLTETRHQVNAAAYLQKLKDTCMEQLKQKEGFKNMACAGSLLDTLSFVNPNENLPLVISHGDLQPGNIWWDMDKEQVVIIDWETVKSRSMLYDHAALYYNLRRKNTYQSVVDSLKASSHIKSYAPFCSAESIAKIVMAEEMAYQVEELISFPGEIGLKEFNRVLEQIKTLKL